MKWLFLFLLPLYVLVSAQDMITIDTIQARIINQLDVYPQEKIHLHTDRTMYVPGENIWFKAYVVDALSNQGPTYSQYAYIELINSSESLVNRVMVSCDTMGLFHGHLFLSQFIPEGDYTLRAYTRYMENLGDDYFFKKPIRIGNLTADKTQSSKPATRNDYEVSFFPEGGNLTEGVNCRVAFKALNRDGTTEIIEGRIVDNEGNVKVEVSTVFAGMGSFFLIPEQGKEYFFYSRKGSEQEKRFKLPPAYKTYSIATTYRNNRHFIEVKKTPDIPEKSLYLLVHCKGMVLYFTLWNHQKDYISLLGNELPSGVIQVVLLDEQMNPIGERLIFNKNEKEKAQLAFSTDKPYYQKREKVTSEIYLAGTDGDPLTGHISIAVTDNHDIEIDTLHTITSSLLLSSELRGYIESPGYYLQNHKEAEFALDHLMMTHGWRRYDISGTIKENYSRPKIEFERAKEMSGTVKTRLFSRPVKKAEMIIMSNSGDYWIAETDSTGMFHVDLHYPDSTKFFIQARNQRGSDNVELVLKKEAFPKLKYAPISLSLFSIDSDQKDQSSDVQLDFMKKIAQRVKYDENMWVIGLPEVTITAKGPDKRDEIRLQNWTAIGSDRTIYREEFENRHVSRVSDLLLGIAGVQVSQGRISIRGYGAPIILVDAVVWHGSIDDLTVDEIECIDIHKGASAAIFGLNGSNGAISITTRRGTAYTASDDYSRLNTSSLTPLGYQKPVEFYAPIYDTPELRNSKIPDYRTTIYWKPDVLVSDEGKASFEFYASDFLTSYSVVIEGMSDDGKIVRQVETIEVK